MTHIGLPDIGHNAIFVFKAREAYCDNVAQIFTVFPKPSMFSRSSGSQS